MSQLRLLVPQQRAWRERGQTQTHNTPEASKYQHGFPHPDTRTAATSDPEPPGNTSLRAGLHQPATPQNTSSAFSSSNSMLLTRIKSRPRISSITLVATSGQTFRKNTHSPSGSSPNNSVFATNTNASERRKLPAESAPQTSNIGAAGFMAIIACVVLFVGLMHFKVWDEIKRRRPEAVCRKAKSPVTVLIRNMASKLRKVPPGDGFVRPGFEHVQDIFRQSIENGVERGGNFAAYFRGELVVNLWGGFADEEANRPWKHNTAGIFYSTTKSPSAVTIAHLVDRGFLSYDQPISSFWPEFGQNGKEQITLKQMVSLKAGLPLLTDPFPLSLLRDDLDDLSRRLAQQIPWNTGGIHAYSPLVIGLYLDQIVRRADPQKRSLSEYFRQEIAEPFGIDLSIGMPKSEQWRVPRMTVTVRGAEYKKYQMQLAINPNIDMELLLQSQTQPTDWLRNAFIHNPDMLELPCGASHGVGSAAGMARLHGILANGGSLAGRRLLSEDAIQLLQTPVSAGPEKLFGIDLFYSYGMELIPVLDGNKVTYNMGHGGFGGQFAAADTQYKTGWAYVTNYLDPTIMLAGKAKWPALEKALYQCIHKLEGVNVTRRHLMTSNYPSYHAGGGYPPQFGGAYPPNSGPPPPPGMGSAYNVNQYGGGFGGFNHPGAVPGFTVPAVQQCNNMMLGMGFQGWSPNGGPAFLCFRALTIFICTLFVSLQAPQAQMMQQQIRTGQSQSQSGQDDSPREVATPQPDISEEELKEKVRAQMRTAFINELVRREKVSGTFELTEGTVKPFVAYDDNDPVAEWYKTERGGELKKWDCEADCEYLNDAMKGLGTNDDAIIHVVATRCNSQRQQMKKMFKTLYGRDLIEEIKGELSGDYKETVMALFLPPAEYDAWCIKEAIYGPGTDESALIEIFLTRTNAQIEEIRNAYPSVLNKHYHGKEPKIEEDIRNDTSGDFKRLLISASQGNRYEIPRDRLVEAVEEIVNPETDEGTGMYQVNYAKLSDTAKAEREAKQLFEAGEDRWGTDEETFIRIFATRDYYQLRETWNQYVKLTQRDILNSVKRETSGDFKSGLRAIVMNIRSRPMYFAEKLRDAMKGLGTDERTLIRIIVSRSEIDMVQIKECFLKLTEKTLWRWIKEDTSFNFKKLLQQIVGRD
ncbi:hypothetical protein BaRGS_00001120 [Batillaria attramentaria]|uniref:Annexin n=1 Tax=Batillaria attramentaria TaxID=370345 RepID=A0ABD0M5H3_9CAEN